MQFIDLKTQYQKIDALIQQRINAVLEHGKFIMGPEVAELETRLEEYTGAAYCINVASGTDALLIAMMALDIKPGDEVITTPFSFISTAETIVLLGAKPVFVDIQEDTYNLDPTLLEQAITPKTKAIMPVSLYGQCADFDTINQIAESHGIPVIEDAAQSFGATYAGKKSCNLSTIGCTSFFPSKPFGAYGDGGACFTNNEELATRMKHIRVHGQDKRYHHYITGVNGRLDTIQAAILLAKMELFPEEVEARKRIGARYSQLISENTTEVGVPLIAEGNTSVYAQYTIRVKERDKLIEKLKQNDIPTAIHYPIPLHKQPAITSLQSSYSLPIAENCSDHVMSLPMYPYLEETTQDYIVESVCKALS